MKLHWSPRSPFVRKVMIVLHETGQVAQVDCIRSVVAVQLPPNEAVLADNPLGKIPALVTEDGKAIFDSRVICEYLDMRAKTALFPSDIAARLDQLCWQALADGLIDILLVWRTELARQTGPWGAVTSGWQVKVRASMARLERESPALMAAPFGIGHVSVIVALGQLDFRWPDCAWRNHFPNLALLCTQLSLRASAKATLVPEDEEAGAGALTAGHLTF